MGKGIMGMRIKRYEMGRGIIGMRRTEIKGKYQTREVTLIQEQFDSFEELLRTCDKRKNNGGYNRNYRDDETFIGVNTYEEAANMLRYGYAPNIQEVRTKINKTINTVTSKNGIAFRNDVVGFAPNVPNAIMGVPQSMISMKRVPKRAKVIHMIVDIGVLGKKTAEQVNSWGIKLIEKIISLEMSGYRIRLEYLKCISNDQNNNYFLVRVLMKNEFNPFDLKRMSFPLSHVAMQRAIVWDWLERIPDERAKRYFYSYGQSLSCNEAKSRRDFVRSMLCKDPNTYMICIFDNIDEQLSGIK